MASGSSSYVSHNEGSSDFTELVANSSLTATASEFVPNCASRNRYRNRANFSKSNASSSRSSGEKEFFSGQGNGTTDGSFSVRNGSGGHGQNRQEYFSSSGDYRRANGNDYYSSQSPGAAGSSSRSSARFSGKYNNGSKGQHRGRKDWPGSSGPMSNGVDEGAVGGDHVKTYYNRDLASGFNRSKDRNDDNKEQGEYHYADKPFYDDNKPKYRDDRDLQRVTSESNKAHKRDSNRCYDKDFDHGRDKPRHWDRERETSSYSDDAPRDTRAPERYRNQYSDRGQEQDKYYSKRPNRRYADRSSGGQRDDYNRDRYFGYHEHEERSSDRHFGSRGTRFNHDFVKEDPSRQRNMSSQRGRNLTHNFHTHETFSSDPIKMQTHESNLQDRAIYGSSNKEHGSTSRRQNLSKNLGSKDADDVSQRDRLTEQLSRGTLECLVCCDRVRQQDSVWSCSNCFHVLHLRCVTKWAKSSKAETGWRCPACQNVTETVPSQYRCFCGKILEPQWNRQDTPHTCGEVCGKSREGHRSVCTHRCNLLCHPGPCPPCTAQVTRNCGCGKTSQTVKCASEKALLCEASCGKVLACGVHTCEAKCHSGPCCICQRKIHQVCFCKKQTRGVDCLPENQGIFEFSCNEPCGHDLTCGNHKCDQICHEGECKSCQLAPDLIVHCPCGQTELSQNPDEKRKSCLEPIPTCAKICSRKLPCGQPSNPHQCKTRCHSGMCPPCQLTTFVRCRCGHMDRELPCDQLTSKADDARCEKKCTKKRSCAKHKCNQLCCIEIDHPCPLPCNHNLSCGLHRCELLCHRGHCQPCWRTSFEELFCECGTEVMYPPVPCGTKPPACSRPCTRQHGCEHPALHTCHSDPNCPPCTVLTQKYCYGNHELRRSIPCHQKEFSCGLPCNKELPCRHHKCIQLCHKGDCVREGSICSQPCTIPRPTCQHPCSASCHEGSCPDSPCKENVRVTCECGHRSAMRPCAENTKEYQRIATSLLASKMADVQLGHSIDIGDIMGNASTKKLYLKSLECNEECKVIERNRRMAIGLQIRNPDLSQKLTPRYSEFMRGYAKKDSGFCQYVHDKLTELVKLAKESKQKSRSYSFEVMNREKRQFIHEYCEHFGCESVAYDQEPKRNVVATAQKAKAWLPSVGLLELVQREAGQRKVPGPILNSVKKPLSRNMDTLSNKWTTKPGPHGGQSSTSSGSSVWPSTSLPSSSNLQFDDLSADGSTNAPYIDHFNS